LNAGNFRNLAGVNLGTGDNAGVTRKTLTFGFTDNGAVKGIKFATTAADTSITFTLNIAGHPATTSQLFLGGTPTHPPSGSPLTNPRHPPAPGARHPPPARAGSRGWPGPHPGNATSAAAAPDRIPCAPGCPAGTAMPRRQPAHQDPPEAATIRLPQ